MSEWKETTIGELITLQRGHDLVQSEFVDGEYLVAGSNGPIGYHNKFTTKGPGITIGRSGNSIGVAHFYEKDFWAHNTTMYAKMFHGSYPKFVYYLLKSFDFKSYDGGSAVPTLDRKNIHPITVVVPCSIDEQKRIAETLSCIDDKIDLFKRQNKTVEQLAETIFKQWFLIEANESWEEGNFSLIIHQVKDRIKDSSTNSEDIKVLSAVKTGDLVLSEDYFTKQVFSKDIGKYIVVKQFDFAYNPSRINIGSIGMLRANITGAVSPVYVVLRPKKNWQYYLQFMLKQQYVKSTIEIYASGSVRQSLDYDSFSKIEIKLPPFEKVEMFNKYYSDSLNKINANNKQINTLTHLRETLLPKLISGEVRVEN